MPMSKTAIKDLGKDALVDAGCDFFEDPDGTLRDSLNEMSVPDLVDLLYDNGYGQEEEEEVVEVKVKPGPPSKLDLGNW